MKIVATLMLFTALAFHVTAQSSLDQQITSFAEQHKLINKKLYKLDAIQMDSSLSEEERKIEWEKAYANWDKRNKTESFNAEMILVKSLPDLYYEFQSKITGYTFDYLIARTDELTRLGQLSETNAILLKQLLRKQVSILPELSEDVTTISEALKKFFTHSSIGLSHLDQLSAFITTNDPNLVGKDLQTKIKAVQNYNQNDWDAYSKYLRGLGIQQSKYAQISKLTGQQELLEVHLLTVLGSMFENYLQVGQASYITYWKDHDYVKHQMFLENEEITNFLLMKLLTESFHQAQRKMLNSSEIGQHIIKEYNFPSYDALISMEDAYTNHDKRFILADSSVLTIQKLFVAAYNDVYFDYEKGVSIKIDWNDLGLSLDQSTIIEAIQNSTIQGTQEGLKAGFSNGLFEEIDWDIEFKLACYLALYNKTNALTREWNNSEYIVNPFAEMKNQVVQKYDVFDSLEWNQLKNGCKKMLESNGYSKKKFQISYDSESVFTVYPSTPEKALIKQLVKNAMGDRSNFGYFRMIVETDELAIEPIIFQEVWPRDVVVAPPPPPSASQRNNEQVDAAEIIEFPDTDASFPGGSAAMKKWIDAHLQYPEISRELGDQGRVYITFVVEPDGSITGVDVMRGGITPELNREAKRLVRTMPKWVPGEANGQKVRARCRLPITFSLENQK